MSGKFSLEEANSFAIEALDNTAVPNSAEYFEHKVDIFTMAIAGNKMPPKMAYVVNNFSVLEPVDEYLFHVVKHDIVYFCNSLQKAEANDIRRMRSKRRDRIRLGFAPLPGTSDAEIEESRPVRGWSSVDYDLDHDSSPF